MMQTTDNQNAMRVRGWDADAGGSESHCRKHVVIDCEPNWKIGVDSEFINKYDPAFQIHVQVKLLNKYNKFW